MACITIVIKDGELNVTQTASSNDSKLDLALFKAVEEYLKKFPMREFNQRESIDITPTRKLLC